MHNSSTHGDIYASVPGVFIGSGAFSASTHHHWCWVIFNCALGNKLQWNFYPKIQQFAFKNVHHNVVCNFFVSPHFFEKLQHTQRVFRWVKLKIEHILEYQWHSSVCGWCFELSCHFIVHYCDVIIGAVASQIDCLLNRLFRRRSKKTSKLCVTGLCAGNSPGTGEFPAQMASNGENVSIWWRHHEMFYPHSHTAVEFLYATK